MTFTPDFLLQVMLAVGAGISVYAAIRADLAKAIAKAEEAAAAANKAHDRIDSLIMRSGA